METPIQPPTVIERSVSVLEKLNNLLTVPITVLFAALMISGSILYVGNAGTALIAKTPTGQEAQKEPDVVIKDPSTLITDSDPVLGSTKAKVTIVEFSDFQCPFCRSFFEGAYSEIKKQYIDTGKVRLVFRDYPLPFHPAAKPAALAGQCAREQDMFWQFHDKMFQEQAKSGQGTVTFGIPELKAWASQVGLNISQFNQCLDSAKYEADVQVDMDAGNSAGVSGTPSFFVNGRLLVGAQPFSTFQELIDAELDK